jgi:hypothetical protein
MIANRGTRYCAASTARHAAIRTQSDPQSSPVFARPNADAAELTIDGGDVDGAGSTSHRAHGTTPLDRGSERRAGFAPAIDRGLEPEHAADAAD